MLNLKPLAVYILATVSSYWMILSALTELEISGTRKSILDDFLFSNGIPLIKKKYLYSLMYLCFSDISSGRGILGTFRDGFLCRFIPYCSKCIAGPHMWSDLTESLMVSGQS